MADQPEERGDPMHAEVPAQGEDPIATLVAALADQLERWATEAEEGGWSTYQVGSQRQWAARLRAALGAAPAPSLPDATPPQREEWVVEYDIGDPGDPWWLTAKPQPTREEADRVRRLFRSPTRLTHTLILSRLVEDTVDG